MSRSKPLLRSRTPVFYTWTCEIFSKLILSCSNTIFPFDIQYFLILLRTASLFLDSTYFCWTSVASLTILCTRCCRCYQRYISNNNNHGSTALYGLGPPLSEVTMSLCICSSEGPAHCRAFRLDPDVTARWLWQSVRRLGWEMAAWI
jgi:hypothetical protein